MIKTYKSIRGTYDFSPAETYLFNQIAEKARHIFALYGYDEIILPFLEEEGVFIRSVGETTDIVEKQIFRIAKRSETDSDIVLRPEGTAQVVRYYLEHALYKQSDFNKFSYIGAMFRGERPQKGRLRQFHHIGAEAMGSDSIFLDAEMISLSLKLLDEIGITERKLNINTLGCQADKEKFMSLLKKDLSARRNELCPDCQRRLLKNPLRILDCKQEHCKKIAVSFCLSETSGKTYLCKDCDSKFQELLKLFKSSNIDYVYNPCLVRGLDYYTNTVFEITSSSLGSQDAIGAGGRYNNLIKNLGGPDIPACGFALGVERVMLALNKSQAQIAPDVFIAVTGENLRDESFKMLQVLRAANVHCDMDYCAKSLKGQLRYAEKKGINFVLIVAEEEYSQGFVILKNMEASSQEKIKIGDLTEVVRGVVADGEGIA
ncbi:MAG: histidine--tRNA ligase [Candidatus Omnitrophica bacterium]|jgi:histidyl-tRNA synthetase|nr:histidine--tRNA ligase [Candidatus Omnitrophota bacterium]